VSLGTNWCFWKQQCIAVWSGNGWSGYTVIPHYSIKLPFQGICRDGENTLWIAGLHALIGLTCKQEYSVFKTKEVKGMGAGHYIHHHIMNLPLHWYRTDGLIFDKQTKILWYRLINRSCSLSSNRVAVCLSTGRKYLDREWSYGLAKAISKKKNFITNRFAIIYGWSE